MVSEIEKDTCLVPSIVADTVVTSLAAWLDSQKEAVAERMHGFEPGKDVEEVERVVAFLDDNKDDIAAEMSYRTEAIYQQDSRFNARIRSEEGRDFLYSFMQHWMCGRLHKEGHGELVRAIPEEYRHKGGELPPLSDRNLMF